MCIASSSHCTCMYYINMHCTVLHYIVLPCIRIALHGLVVSCSACPRTSLHCLVLICLYFAMHCLALPRLQLLALPCLCLTLPCLAFLCRVVSLLCCLPFACDTLDIASCSFAVLQELLRAPEKVSSFVYYLPHCSFVGNRVAGVGQIQYFLTTFQETCDSLKFP